MIKQILMGMLLICILAGCAPTPTGVDSPTIIVFWHTFTGSRAEALEALGDRFNLENDGEVTLIVEYQENIYAKVAAAAPEQRPDIVLVSPQEAAQYHAAGLALPLTDASPTLQQNLDDLLPMGAALYTRDGALQAVPLGLATYVLYYNDDWLHDLGYTPATMTTVKWREAVCAAADPTSGQAGLGVNIQPGTLLALLAAGGSAVIEDGAHYRVNDTAAIGMAVVLYDVFHTACGRMFDMPANQIEQFSNGVIAMALETSLQVAAIEEAVALERTFQLNVSPLPGPTGPGNTLWYGPGMLLVATTEARQAVAIRTLSWFLTPETQAAWSARSHYLPVCQRGVELRLNASEVSPLETQLLQLILEASARAGWRVWPGYADAGECRGALIQGLLDLNSATSPAATLEMVQSVCNAEVRP